MESGTRLGPYEIQKQLGAGGMGEVYLAEDTRLGRKVAIKVLPEQFAGDPERLARFEQEARAAAALNHPHIAAVHDVGESDGTHFIVQEYLAGDSLRDLLGDGPLALERAVELGGEVAEALAAAHRAGIIHRDIKPENIFVTEQGHAKVLDFGLAKLAELGVTPESGASLSPTVLGTAAGTIMGTAGYMAPEQVKGEEIDRRADLFAFGCVLYEMVNGARAFAGDTVHHTLHRIVAEEPEPPSDGREGLPVRLQWLVDKCLAKEPARRYQDADDLVVDLRTVAGEIESGMALTAGAEGAGESLEPAALPSWKEAIPTRIAVAIVLALALAAALAGSFVWRPAPVPGNLVRFDLPLALDTDFTNTNQQALAISPDGSRIAFGATEQLWMRVLDQREPVPLRNTIEARSPFFSPDSRQLGFWADGQLKRMAVTGGAPVSLVPAERPFGVHWATDGYIYYGDPDRGLLRVADRGGESEVMVPVQEGESLYGPLLLPGGEWLLLTVAPGPRAWNDGTIVAHSLGTGERRELVAGGHGARYVPTGHIVYLRDGVLHGVPFDAEALVVTGGPVSLVEGVRRGTASVTGAAFYDFDARGNLVYVPGGESGGGLRLVWIDRAGTVEPLPFPERQYGHQRLSPDGSRIAVTVQEEGPQVWVYEVAQGTGQQLTREGENQYPVWSPDGEWIYFERVQAGQAEIWRRRSDMSGDAEPVVQHGNRVFPYSISADGERLLFVEEPADDPAVRNIWIVSLQDGAEPVPLVSDRGLSRFPRFSPDGRYFVYDSNESGPFQIYVMEIESGRRWPVSTTGGETPLWPAQGGEILFQHNGFTWAAPVDLGTDFEAGTPVNVAQGTATIHSDATAGGYRMLLRRESADLEERQARPRVNVVLNWFQDLRDRIPGDR